MNHRDVGAVLNSLGNGALLPLPGVGAVYLLGHLIGSFIGGGAASSLTKHHDGVEVHRN